MTAKLAPLVVAAALGSAACEESPHGAPAADAAPEPTPRSCPARDLGPSLEAGFEDPILLTFAAARARTSYRVDEGYTFASLPDGPLAFVTDTAGSLGLALELEDGRLIAGEGELVSALAIEHTTSDALQARAVVDASLGVRLRFAAVTSRAATLELELASAADRDRTIGVLAWLRRCDGYLDAAPVPRGARARHHVPPDPVLAVVGPGTYVEDLADALVAETGPARASALAACGPSLTGDLARLAAGAAAPGGDAAALAVRRDVVVPAGGSVVVRFHRGVAEQPVGVAEHPVGDALAEAAAAGELCVPDLLAEGVAGLARAPTIEGADETEALVHRSSFALLDQLVHPAEGLLGHDYFLFSREPTWWFARLGEHIHEALAVILLARLDPEAAESTLRNFFDRVEPDGYLPYSLGPVVEQTTARTASAPLLAYVSWEVYRVTDDDDFLREAYEAAVRTHAFWLAERDKDADGLSEWGGIPLTESVRDLENVIWEHVGPGNQFEEVDLNCMLVMEERSLGEMAARLGLPDEAAAWAEAATARAARINERMWDPETSFYYHVTFLDHDFGYQAPDDLKRMEIAGLLPLWAGIVPPERLPALLGQLTDPARFWRAGGVPGLAADDPYYSPDASRCCRWNGAVWVPWQLLILRGLLDAGRPDLARELAARTLADVRLQLAARHQFRELYSPDDPGGPNDSMPNYVWSSLATLMALEIAAY